MIYLYACKLAMSSHARVESDKIKGNPLRFWLLIQRTPCKSKTQENTQHVKEKNGENLDMFFPPPAGLF